MDILNTVVKAAGWTIVHSLWQSTLLYIILYILLTLNPKLSAKSRYNLSFLTLIGIFVWVLITFYAELSRSATLEAGSGINDILQSSIISNQVGLPASVMSKIEQFIPLLVFIYGAGLMIRMTFLIVSYYKIREIRTIGLSALPSHLHQRFSDLIVKMGIIKKVRFNLSNKVSVPLMIGYFKPVVLIPLSAITQLETKQLEAIIIHELAHIRRNDYLFNLIKVFIETILFFNPFVLIIGRIVDAERENACDDVAIEMTGTPMEYIETLFQLQELKYNEEQLSMAITKKKYHLLNRIKRIANMKTSNINQQWQLFVVLMTLTVALSLAWIPVTKDKAPANNNNAAPLKSAFFNARAQQNLIQEEKQLNISSRVRSSPQIKNRNIVMDKGDVLADTLPKFKGKFKIVIEGENGDKKEYNSLGELPEDMRMAFLKQNGTLLKETPSFSKSEINRLSTSKYSGKAGAEKSKSDEGERYPGKVTTSQSKPKERTNENDSKGPGSKPKSGTNNKNIGVQKHLESNLKSEETEK